MTSSLAERLRGIVRPAAASRLDGRPLEAPATGQDTGRPASDHAVADALGGRVAESRNHQYVIIDRVYRPGHRHGRVPMMDAMPPWPMLSLLGPGELRAGRAVFIDVETTGLAGGAGSLAFLIGCGWFEGPAFRVRQFFLSTYGAEQAVLEGLAELAAEIGVVISFNGKSFDLPLIETRFLFHRMATPFAGVPHVDMLHAARRLWRPEDHGEPAGCRLSVLERTLCGVAREGDVPGFEIPSRYFSYVRSANPAPLEPVFEHNRLDLISLALLTARASHLLEAGPASATTAREALGMGALYERAGRHAQACEAYRRAVEVPADRATHAEALRALALANRRLRRFSEAATAWHRLLELGAGAPQIIREATEALAIHHEHRIRDLSTARRFALESLRLEAAPSRREAVHHRLARLERKLAGSPVQSLQF